MKARLVSAVGLKPREARSALCYRLLMSDPRNELDEEPAAFVFEEAVELDAREQKAMADIDAGRFITHEAVMLWLKSWGTADELPPPKCGD